jgi:isopentenyl-diphosphate delta-isomerase
LLAIERAGETGLERFRLAHRALPGLDLAEVSLRTRLLGAELAAPVVLAGDCARTATEHGLGLISNVLAPERPPLWLVSAGVGELRDDGAVRLAAGLEADGLVVRLNGMEDPRMRGAWEAIAAVVDRLAPLPVMVRGGGYGLDAADVRELVAAGVAAIDVGGAIRPGWGVPTADAVAEGVLAACDRPVLAEVGGAVDAAKCLALGARAVSLVADDVATVIEELRLALWSVGARAPSSLTPGHLRQPDPWRPPPA